MNTPTHTVLRPSYLLTFAAVGVLTILGGCSSTPRDSVTKLELPDQAKVAPQLAPLAFMAGTWRGVNPRKTINEEHWSEPLGKTMLGTFRQIKLDGLLSLVELTLIRVKDGKVELLMRHLHGELEVPQGREKINVFTLKSASRNVAEFTGTGDAEKVTGVIYRLVNPNELHVEVNFAPDSGEKPFTSKYTRAN